jgi:hypothetical protein
MKKRWVILIAVLSLGLGAGGASWYWLNFKAQFNNYGFVVRTQADIVTKVAVLEHIRAGRISDATNLLETLLDGDLIGAGALARDGTQFNANTGRAVVLESKARATSGYRPTEDSVHSAVQEAFRLVPLSVKGAAAQPIIPPDLPRQAAPGR